MQLNASPPTLAGVAPPRQPLNAQQHHVPAMQILPARETTTLPRRPRQQPQLPPRPNLGQAVGLWHVPARQRPLLCGRRATQRLGAHGASWAGAAAATRHGAAPHSLPRGAAAATRHGSRLTALTAWGLVTAVG